MEDLKRPKYGVDDTLLFMTIVEEEDPIGI
jgi:hypothetical protein